MIFLPFKIKKLSFSEYSGKLSYNLFIKELTDRKIIEQQKEKEEKIKIIEDPKIYVNEYEINEIKLEKEII